jgi:chemotaxis protein MotB
VNHERWLVSYADFITLLFAFFVMMYANSITDKARAQGISEAFREAMKEDRLAQALSKLLGKPETEPRRIATQSSAARRQSTTSEDGALLLLPSLQELNQTLKSEIDAGRLEVRLERRGLVISLREATFFPSGGDAVEPGTLPTLEVIARELRRHTNPIRLEGHTDSVPINTARFRSNWELSAARGISMLELFATSFGIERNRMAIAGYADTAPVDTNSSPEGRSRNRRVDIVILNEEGQSQQPSRWTGPQPHPNGATGPKEPRQL